MIALYILGIIVLIILALLLLPLTVYLEFYNSFAVKIKFAGIKVFSQKEEKPQKKASDKTTFESDKKSEGKVKSLFEALKEKKGFTGAVKEIFAFLQDCLVHFKQFLKFVKFRKVKLNLNVASDNAADTAIMYGGVCAAVYPVLAFFDSIANVKYKQINIKSDFDSKKSDFNFSLNINLQILFLLIAAFKVYKEYKKFVVRNDLQ